jgi:hypothetical protein
VSGSSKTEVNMIQMLQQHRMTALLVANKIRLGAVPVRLVIGPFGRAAFVTEAVKAEREEVRRRR